jgi:hypothetical protein
MVTWCNVLAFRGDRDIMLFRLSWAIPFANPRAAHSLLHSFSTVIPQDME